MTAHDILTLSTTETSSGTSPAETGRVTEATPAMLLLPQLLESPDAKVEVTGSDGGTVGVVDARAMLRCIGTMLGDARESSWVEATVAASAFSASSVARAVEDADANLLDMLTSADPADGNRLRISLRVSHADPSGVVRSLERYGYEVTSSSGVVNEDYDKARRHLSELELYLNM